MLVVLNLRKGMAQSLCSHSRSRRETSSGPSLDLTHDSSIKAAPFPSTRQPLQLMGSWGVRESSVRKPDRNLLGVSMPYTVLDRIISRRGCSVFVEAAAAAMRARDYQVGCLQVSTVTVACIVVGDCQGWNFKTPGGQCAVHSLTSSYLVPRSRSRIVQYALMPW